MITYPSLDHLGHTEMLEHSFWLLITTKVYSSSPIGKKTTTTKSRSFCSIFKLFSRVLHIGLKTNKQTKTKTMKYIGTSRLGGGHGHGFLSNSGGLSPYGLNI